jgi:hypothetical protein
MRAFGADLQAVVEGRAPTARRASMLGRMLRKAGTHRVPAGFLVILIVIIAGLCVLLAIMAH